MRVRGSLRVRRNLLRTALNTAAAIAAMHAGVAFAQGGMCSGGSGGGGGGGGPMAMMRGGGGGAGGMMGGGMMGGGGGGGGTNMSSAMQMMQQMQQMQQQATQASQRQQYMRLQQLAEMRRIMELREQNNGNQQSAVRGDGGQLSPQDRVRMARAEAKAERLAVLRERSQRRNEARALIAERRLQERSNLVFASLSTGS